MTGPSPAWLRIGGERCNGKLEFTSKALVEWAYRCGVKLAYTRPEMPTDNGLIESFNGRASAGAVPDFV